QFTIKTSTLQLYIELFELVGIFTFYSKFGRDNFGSLFIIIVLVINYRNVESPRFKLNLVPFICQHVVIPVSVSNVILDRKSSEFFDRRIPVQNLARDLALVTDHHNLCIPGKKIGRVASPLSNGI